MPFCSYCSSNSICLSCETGYILSSQICIKASNDCSPGCKICLNNTYCLECSENIQMTLDYQCTCGVGFFIVNSTCQPFNIIATKS